MENEENEKSGKTFLYLRRTGLFVMLTIGFALMIPAVAFLTETIKKSVAAKLGYEMRYDPYLLHMRYFNDAQKEEMHNIEASFPLNNEGFRKDPRWNLFNAQYTRGYMLIELSGRLFTIGLSLIGLTVFLLRRRHHRPMVSIDYIAVIFSLCYFKDIIFDALGLYFFYLVPEEVILWEKMGISPVIALSTFSCLGVIVLTLIIYKIPRERVIFIASAVLGVFLGLHVWLDYAKTIEPSVIPETMPEKPYTLN